MSCNESNISGSISVLSEVTSANPNDALSPLMSIPAELWPFLVPPLPIRRNLRYPVQPGDNYSLRFLRVECMKNVIFVEGDFRWESEYRTRYATRVLWNEQHFRARLRNIVLFSLISRATMQVAKRFLAEAFLCDCMTLAEIREIDGKYTIEKETMLYTTVKISFATIISQLYNRLAFYIGDGLAESNRKKSGNLCDFGSTVGHATIKELMPKCPPNYVIKMCILMMEHNHFHIVCLLRSFYLSFSSLFYFFFYDYFDCINPFSLRVCFRIFPGSMISSKS
jgi:hypothetical protein